MYIYTSYEGVANSPQLVPRLMHLWRSVAAGQNPPSEDWRSGKLLMASNVFGTCGEYMNIWLIYG